MAVTTENGCANHEHIDPRVRRTRRLIQDAFRSLIHSKRFSEISVQDIAEHATVNRATFYAHYVDKNDLAASVLKNDLREAVIKKFSEKPVLTRESLTQFSIAVFEFMAGVHGSCPSAGGEIQDIVGPALQEGLHELVEGFVSSGNSYKRLFPGCSKEVVVTTISWSIYGNALRWSRSKDPSSVNAVCRELVSILIPEGIVRTFAS